MAEFFCFYLSGFAHYTTIFTKNPKSATFCKTDQSVQSVSQSHSKSKTCSLALRKGRPVVSLASLTHPIRGYNYGTWSSILPILLYFDSHILFGRYNFDASCFLMVAFQCVILSQAFSWRCGFNCSSMKRKVLISSLRTRGACKVE